VQVGITVILKIVRFVGVVENIIRDGMMRRRKMRINKEGYYKTMAKALLRGYFLGVDEERKRWLNRCQKCIFSRKKGDKRRKVKRS